jgi:hypothetical protein
MSRLTAIALVVLFCFVAFDAALRYAFQQAGLTFLIYAKDGIALAIAALLGLRIARAGKVDLSIVTIVGLLGFGMIVGLISGLPIAQMLFGFKIWIMLLVGVALAYSIEDIDAWLIWLYRVLLPIVVFGLVLDATTALPWKGLEYEAMGQSIEGSREWSTFGLPRLAGFGRASYESAALIVGLSALYLAIRLSGKQNRGRFAALYDSLLLAVGFAGVLLTTSKSSIVVFAVLLLAWVALRARAIFPPLLRAAWRGMLKIAVVLLVLLMIVPPIVAYVSPDLAGDLLSSDDVLVQAFTLSFVERVEVMWPAAFALLTNPIQVLVGRGVGGIGTAQLYFEPAHYNAADNAAVYLLVQFGLIAVVFFVGYILWCTSRLRLDSPKDIYLFQLILLIAGYGSSVNIVESPALMLTIGLFLAFWRQSVRTGA